MTVLYLWFWVCVQESTVVIKKIRKSGGGRSKEAELRRILRGLGSSPPRCSSKCGRCTPCKPVHVPVPPGTPVTAEYYPEAWRCKCGNKLYMPWSYINIYILTYIHYDLYGGLWSCLMSLLKYLLYILNMLLGQTPTWNFWW